MLQHPPDLAKKRFLGLISFRMAPDGHGKANIVPGYVAENSAMEIGDPGTTCPKNPIP